MERTMTLDQVRVLLHDHLEALIGPFLAILFSGGLIILGIMCMILLSSKGQGSTRQKRIAQIYVILIVMIVPGYLVDQLIALFLGAFESYEQNGYLKYVFAISDGLFSVVIMALTDGLLVWRCFMVQRGLGPNNRKLQVLFWIIPMSLWGIIIVTGFIVMVSLGAWRDCETLHWCKNLIGINKSIGILSNAILNLFATGYIVTLLLIHRRKLIYLHGQKFSTFHHTCIIGILVQSSIINAPVAILAAVHLYIPGAFKTNVFPLVLACQAFMSVLIVYQVAIDRASRQRDEDNLENDVEKATITWNRVDPVQK